MPTNSTVSTPALNPITARRLAAEAAAPVGTCAGCGGACAPDELYCSAACLDTFDKEPTPAPFTPPAFAPNLLPLHPELLARAIAVLRLGAPDMPRDLACEASLVADALAKAGRRPNTDGSGIRRHSEAA